MMSVSFAMPVAAQSEPYQELNLYFFWGEGCPHCAKEKIFLENLKEKYPGLKIYEFEIWHNSDNVKILQEVGEELKADISLIPFTVVGEKYNTGYLSDETSGADIEDIIKYALRHKYRDVAGEITGIVKPSEPTPTIELGSEEQQIPEKITLPVFGEIAVKNFSLPILSAIFGILDGFNPCAMWTLIFLIGLLLNMKNKKRMWVLGGTFIAASAGIYFLFMTAWLNLFLFLGMIFAIRLAIGLVALGAGWHNLKEYFTNKNVVCKVTKTEKRQKIFEKLKQITQQQKFWLALAGIILLACAVNMVEAVCSAGLPAIFTRILTITDLPVWQYYCYILLYLFFFMLDDMIVFFTAMATLKVVGGTAKYTRASNLIGGILMLALGLLLIFKPEWLMFG